MEPINNCSRQSPSIFQFWISLDAFYVLFTLFISVTRRSQRLLKRNVQWTQVDVYVTNVVSPSETAANSEVQTDDKMAADIIDVFVISANSPFADFYFQPVSDEFADELVKHYDQKMKAYGGGEMTSGGGDLVADVRHLQPYQPAVISPGKHRVSLISLSVSSYLCVCVCVCVCVSVLLCLCVSVSLGLCVFTIVSLCAVWLAVN